MKEISEINKLYILGNSTIYYEGKKIGKWWGKTLFAYNAKSGNLEYKNFSIIGLIFHHVFGYKKAFSDDGLRQWVLSKNIQLQPSGDQKITKKVVLETLERSLMQKQKFLFFSLDLVKTSSSDQEIIQMFKDGLDPNTILDGFNTSVLQQICSSKKFEAAEYLINQGADVNSADTIGRTPLQYAIRHGNEKVSLLLIEKGADVNAKNFLGQTPLHLAIKGLKTGDPLTLRKIIQVILSKNVDLNVFDRRGKTPLHYACQTNDLDVIQWLIDKGANVNATRAGYNAPPLLQTIKKGNVDVVALLIERGANLNPMPRKGRAWETPIMLAVGPSITKKWKANPEMIKLLHKNGSNINKATNSNLDTPLHMAIKRRDFETVKLLVELGASTELKNARGKTPLKLAEDLQEHAMIQLLRKTHGTN